MFVVGKRSEYIVALKLVCPFLKPKFLFPCLSRKDWSLKIADLLRKYVFDRSKQANKIYFG